MSENKTQATLVKMANQISLFFESQTPTEPPVASQALAGHLKLFWAPSMRKRLVDQIERGETDGVNPIVVSAIRKYRKTLMNENVHVPAEETLIGPEGGGDAG